MDKIHLTQLINAPREKVWHVMLDDAPYRQWTAAFHPGSHYRGEWKTGEKMLFIGPDENGGEMGMVSRIAECRPHEFVSIEHLGIYQNGVEDTESEMAKQWSPAFENYTLVETPEGTEVIIDMDIQANQKPEFERMWQSALLKLKEIAER